MNRKILALNLLLVALLASLGWLLRARWLEAQKHGRDVLTKTARRTELLPPPSPARPEAAVAANYLQVAQQTLFSKDRNPNVIVEVVPVPPPKPEEPPPPRPAYYGQMALGEPVAFLKWNQEAQKGYRAGEDVGPFKLVAFDRDTITFEWKEKTLEYPLAELKPKQAAPQQAPAAAPAGLPAVQSLSTKMGEGDKSDPVLGPQNGDLRSCLPGDKSPAGTVLSGYKKTVVPGPFGQMCQWEPVK